MPMYAFLLVVLALIGGGPFISIAAVNELFAVGIAYTWASWFASLWLTGLLSGSLAVRLSLTK